MKTTPPKSSPQAGRTLIQTIFSPSLLAGRAGVGLTLYFVYLKNNQLIFRHQNEKS
jgi:hypothetical protein